MKIIKSLIIILILASCSSQKVVVPVDWTNYEAKAMGQGKEGTIILKVYSYGYTVDNAIERAKMDAIHAVLFKGIPGSNLTHPMVKNGRQTHKEYFDNFFGLYYVKAGKRTMIDPLDLSKVFNAPYKLYVQLSNDGSVSASDTYRVGNKYKAGVVVSVNIRELRKKLETDQVIHSLNSGF